MILKEINPNGSMCRATGVTSENFGFLEAQTGKAGDGIRAQITQCLDQIYNVTRMVHPDAVVVRIDIDLVDTPDPGDLRERQEAIKDILEARFKDLVSPRLRIAFVSRLMEKDTLVQMTAIVAY